MKDSLALKVRKLDFSTLSIAFIKLNQANFSLLLPLLVTISILLILVNNRILAGWNLVFNIEISSVVILLKPWIKR